MNKEIKKRKRSFWAVFVVTLLMAIQIVPIAVSAANHSFGDVTDNPATEPTKVSIIHPGDVLTAITTDSSVVYYDKNGTFLKGVSLPNRGDTHTVMDYSDMPSPRQISDDKFKEWKVTRVGRSGGQVDCIALTAVEYPVSSISYQLNGGSNSDANPSEYHEGFGPEMTFALLNFDYTEADWLVDNIMDLYNSLWTNPDDKTETKEQKTLDGISVVITGKLTQFKNRAELQSAIEKAGGKVAGSVSSKTNYLINNDNTSTSSKNLAAKKLGIPILTEEEFVEKFL